MQKLYIEGPHYEIALEDEYDATCHYVYAHGELMRKAGYDIVSYDKRERFDFKNDRTENVIAVLPSGEEVKAKLFFWHSEPYDTRSARYMKQDPVYRCHGLLVSRDDRAAIEDAKRKYNERRCFV